VKSVKIVALSLALACNKSSARKDGAVSALPNGVECERIAGPLPDAPVLGHRFANDRRANHMTFGRTPPESASVKQITDSAAVAKADAKLDSLFATFGTGGPRNPKEASTSPSDVETLRSPSLMTNPAPVNLYEAQGIYAVVPKDAESCGGDVNVAPVVFFFDSTWRYLGSR
jgi:hypothetical protein